MQVCGTTMSFPTNKHKQIALYSLIIAICAKKRKRKVRKEKWCKEWLTNRQQLGSHVTILRELQNGYEKDFIKCMRMDPQTFHRLLTMVSPLISKQNTFMRMSIPVEARLKATLQFLSTGCSYTYLQFCSIQREYLNSVWPK